MPARLKTSSKVSLNVVRTWRRGFWGLGESETWVEPGCLRPRCVLPGRSRRYPSLGRSLGKHFHDPPLGQIPFKFRGVRFRQVLLVLHEQTNLSSNRKGISRNPRGTRQSVDFEEWPKCVLETGDDPKPFTSQGVAS